MDTCATIFVVFFWFFNLNLDEFDGLQISYDLGNFLISLF